MGVPERSQQLFDKYAKIAVKIGANVQPGQLLIIQAPISTAEFVHKLVESAYEVGAKSVYVDYNDEELTRLKLLLEPEEGLRAFPAWKAKGFEEMAKDNAALLQVYAPNPFLLRDADPDRVALANETTNAAMRAFRRFVIDDKINWSIVSVPTDGWAASVFPDLPKAKREAKLWELIFSMARVSCDDPVQAWNDHIHNLVEKATYLTKKRYKRLHYRSATTDLTIELPNGHIWLSAQGRTDAGSLFVPNIPTEEVFTVPLSTGTNGVVAGTKPLNYNGALIEDFSLTFKDGKVVDFSAESGYETLKRLLDTDAGARSLGEVAIVPHDSPISNTNVLFYNTLYDENASCHVALGSAYPTCIEGGTDMSSDERKKRGLNDSLIHVDFMIGSADLHIDGELDSGEKEPILRNGNWAI